MLSTASAEKDTPGPAGTRKMAKSESVKRKTASRFTAPSVEEVFAYCKERGNSVDPQRFVDYYTSNGWKVGKNTMRDWRAAIRTWENSCRRDKKTRVTDYDGFGED